MLIVNIEKENIEKALKILKRKVNSTKQTKELRKRKEFIKPSVKKRKMMAKARYVQDKYM
jgi:small subunit ribosomal protein S21